MAACGASPHDPANMSGSRGFNQRLSRREHGLIG